jgi:uncharacterized protein DUF6627
MKTVSRNLLCRLLIAVLAWMPFQWAQAGMIGTAQAVAAAPSHADRSALLSLVARPEVASRLQAFGVDPSQAKARVQSMTNEEVAALSQRIESLPAGASDAGWLVVIIIIGAVVWWAMSR